MSFCQVSSSYTYTGKMCENKRQTQFENNLAQMILHNPRPRLLFYTFNSLINYHIYKIKCLFDNLWRKIQVIGGMHSGFNENKLHLLRPQNQSA